MEFYSKLIKDESSDDSDSTDSSYSEDSSRSVSPESVIRVSKNDHLFILKMTPKANSPTQSDLAAVVDGALQDGLVR